MLEASDSLNALFVGAVEAPSLADFAAYLSSKTSGSISISSAQVDYFMPKLKSDETSYSSYVFRAVTGPAFSAGNFLDALSTRLVLRARVEEDRGSQILAIQLLGLPRERTESQFEVDRTREFATVVFTFFPSDYDVIKGPLFEEVVNNFFTKNAARFRSDAGVVGFDSEYAEQMCYYKVADDRCDPMILTGLCGFVSIL